MKVIVLLSYNDIIVSHIEDSEFEFSVSRGLSKKIGSQIKKKICILIFNNLKNFSSFLLYL